MEGSGENGSETPPWWSAHRPEQQRFFGSVRGVGRPLLICDYDGTLAPFQMDKMQAHPYPGVAERLEAIVRGGTEVAFVSGRPSSELVQLLPMAEGLEVWGMHGREHRSRDGRRTVLELTPRQLQALDQVQGDLERGGWADLLERKAGSLALHWRTLAGDSVEQTAGTPSGGSGRTPAEARDAAGKAFACCAGQDGFAVLPFDGGLELRTEDRTKAHAVEALLAQANPAAAAFLGDDLTDEDGFRVMRERGGLALLVRAEVRASRAQFSLRPPGELLGFLDSWIQARAQGGGKTAAPVL